MLVEPQEKANMIIMRHDPFLAMASALDYGWDGMGWDGMDRVT